MADAFYLLFLSIALLGSISCVPVQLPNAYHIASTSQQKNNINFLQSKIEDQEGVLDEIVHFDGEHTHGVEFANDGFEMAWTVQKERWQRVEKLHINGTMILIPMLPLFTVGLIVAVAYLSPFLTKLFSDEGATQPPVEVALALDILSPFVECVIFTTVLLDSLDIAKACSGDAEFSGWFVGIHKMGTASGCLSLWVVMRWNPEIWRWGRTVSTTGICVQLAGTILLAAIGLCAMTWRSDLVQSALLFARFVQGAGGGVQILLTLNHCYHLLPGKQRTSANFSVFAAFSLGLGFGPLFAEASKACTRMWEHYDAGKRVHANEFDSTLLAAIALPLIQLACMTIYPSLDLATDFAEPESMTQGDNCQKDKEADATHTKVVGTPHRSPRLSSILPYRQKDNEADTTHTNVVRRTMVLVFCLMMQISRAFGIAAFEAGITMLLDVEYDWKSYTTAFTMALIFLSNIFIKVAYDQLSSCASDTFWLRLFVIVPLPTSFFLIPMFDATASQVMLLFGSLTVFPLLFMSSALLLGVIQMHAFPSGSILDLHTMNFLLLFFNDVVGRSLGPPAARSSVQHGGQVGFAVLQFMQCGVSILLVETIIYLQRLLPVKGGVLK